LAKVKKAALLIQTVRSIEVLARRGLIKIMTPSEKEKERLVEAIAVGGDVGQFRRQYNAITDTSVRTGEHVHYDDDNHTHDIFEKSYAEIKADNPPAHLRELDAILWFAQVMGVGSSTAAYPVGPRSRGIGQQVEVQKDVVYSNLWPEVSGRDRDIARSVIYQPLSEFAEVINQSPAKTAKMTFQEYSHLSQRLPFLNEEMSAELRRSQYSKVIGTALSYGDPSTTNPKVSCLLGRPFGCTN
jgi:hypothetical protein